MTNLSIFGETKPISDWLIDSRTAAGLYPKLFRTRIKQGWSPEKALTSQVRNPPEGYGKYLYGYPLKECGEIAPNHFVLPDHPDQYTYWLSTDKLSNIHMRSGIFRYVSHGKIVSEHNTYLEAVKCI